MLPGLVPEIEEREAAIFNGYTWREWIAFDLTNELERYQRVAGIAHYRIHQIIEMHRNDAESRELEMRSRRSGS